MRALLAVVVVACSSPMSTVDDAAVSPDSIQFNCLPPNFVVQTPRPDLHYDPNLVAVADMLPYDASGLPGVLCIDELGAGVPSSAPTSSDVDNGLVELRWTFALQPSHRYTLNFFATGCDVQVVFFTSAAQ